MLRSATPLAAAALLAAPAASQLPPKLSWVDILSPSNAGVQDFGWQLATDEDGDRLAVTSRSLGFPSTWSVFAFERFPSGWVETQELTSPVPGTAFPRSLALHGDRLVVADEDASSAAVLYVYGADPAGVWSLEAQLDPQYQLGGGTTFQTATTGDTIFASVGGGVRVFVEDPAQPSGWREDPMIATPAGEFGFGWSMDAVGDRLIVGSNSVAHVFDRDPLAAPGWSEVGYLGPYSFPSSVGAVAVWGDTAVVGDPTVIGGDGLVDYGAAYAHVEDAGGPGAWGLSKKITSLGFSVEFGESVDVGPDHLVVLDSGAAEIGGQAKLYERVALPGPDAWKQVGRLGSNQLGEYTQIRVAGEQVLVGSIFDFLYPTGAVQVFELKDVNVFPGSSTFP